MPVSYVVLGKLRREDHEFKASQVHRGSRPIWTTDMGGRGMGEWVGEESMHTLASRESVSEVTRAWSLIKRRAMIQCPFWIRVNLV